MQESMSLDGALASQHHTFRLLHFRPFFAFYLQRFHNRSAKKKIQPR